LILFIHLFIEFAIDIISQLNRIQFKNTAVVNIEISQYCAGERYVHETLQYRTVERYVRQSVRATNRLIALLLTARISCSVVDYFQVLTV